MKRDLGTLAGSDPFYEYGSSANDVSELGQIVGWSGPVGLIHTPLYSLYMDPSTRSRGRQLVES